MNNNSIHFLLIHQSLATGGVETLMVRMSNWLVEHGHRITLLLISGGELLDLLDKRVKVIILGRSYVMCFLPFWGRSYFKGILAERIDVVYSFEPKTCYFASAVYKYHLGRSRDSCPAFLTGIYHPNALMSKRFSMFEGSIYFNLITNFISDSSKVFMSEQVRAGNEGSVDMLFPDSAIWPLPINGARYRNIKRKPNKFQIVSIGRLAQFKNYNLYMIDVVRELLEEGWDVTWDVHGYGGLESAMKEKIEKAGLLSRIQLHGKLNYEDIKNVLETAYAFVGMGTSLIEAGFCRVPSIPALVDDMDGISYGYLFDLPYYACGERIEKDVQEVKVIDLLRNLFRLSPKEYRLHEEKTYRYVQAYSMDTVMQNFIDMVDKTPKEQRITEYPSWKFVMYFPYCLYQGCRHALSFAKKWLHGR